jgi:hypothetical protein
VLSAILTHLNSNENKNKLAHQRIEGQFAAPISMNNIFSMLRFSPEAETMDNALIGKRLRHFNRAWRDAFFPNFCIQAV